MFDLCIGLESVENGQSVYRIEIVDSEGKLWSTDAVAIVSFDTFIPGFLTGMGFTGIGPLCKISDTEWIMSIV